MIRRVVKQALASSPGWRAVRRFAPPGVRVLTYHRICEPGGPFAGLAPAVFRQQMAWLRRNCNPVAPQDISERLTNGTNGKMDVLVTFDDGYRDFFDAALPVLREFEIPAVVFLATQFVDEGGLIWTEELDWALSATRCERVSLPWNADETLPLRNPAERRTAGQVCRKFLKEQHDDERAEWQARLLNALEVEPAARALPRQFLSWDEVRAARPLITFGGHTHRHRILSRLPAAEVEWEIEHCSRRIAAELGDAPTLFAYPNGRAVDFNEDALKALRRCGYEFAFTTIAGVNTGDADRLALRRIPTGARNTGDFAALVAGWGADG